MKKSIKVSTEKHNNQMSLAGKVTGVEVRAERGQTQTLPKRMDTLKDTLSKPMDTLKDTLSKPLFDFSGEQGADASTHDNNPTNNVSNKHISYGNFMNFVADEEGAIPSQKKNPV